MISTRTYLKESNAIENVQAESALEQALDAWAYLDDQDELTDKVVQRAHDILLKERQPDIAGEYRSIEVFVGDSKPPLPGVIEPLMDNLLDWTPEDPLEAIEWHISFEQIHPFADGNGRIGRLLYLWHCKHVLNIEPIMWRSEDRQGYYELFQSTTRMGIEH